MNAREMILTYVDGNCENVSALLDDYAHELAEEIRHERDAGNIPGSPLAPDAVRGMSYAADLIDPKAQRMSTEGETP